MENLDNNKLTGIDLQAPDNERRGGDRYSFVQLNAAVS